MATSPVVISRRAAPASAISEEERKMRVDLAACYRLVAHYGMDDMFATHISARVPGAEEHFLLNPYGVLFEQVTASDLVKVDLDGNIVQDTPYDQPGRLRDPFRRACRAARRQMRDPYAHGRRHGGRRMEEGLLPLTQKSMRFYNRIGYHDYEGVADDLDERARLVRDLGKHNALILRNHGLLTCGNCRAAFMRCRISKRAARPSSPRWQRARN